MRGRLRIDTNAGVDVFAVPPSPYAQSPMYKKVRHQSPLNRYLALSQENSIFLDEAKPPASGKSVDAPMKDLMLQMAGELNVSGGARPGRALPTRPPKRVTPSDGKAPTSIFGVTPRSGGSSSARDGSFGPPILRPPLPKKSPHRDLETRHRDSPDSVSDLPSQVRPSALNSASPPRLSLGRPCIKTKPTSIASHLGALKVGTSV
jgi:hypothetical protein